MYPVLKEGVSIGTFRCKGSDKVRYYIENADGEDFEISYMLWNALKSADGTKPLNLQGGDPRLLRELEKNGLIQTSRFVRTGSLFNRFILFPIGNIPQKIRSFFKAINAVLPAASILILVIGVCLIIMNGESTGSGFNWWICCGLMVCSIFLHEVGHLIAGVAYGYKISNVGILLLGIIPIGIYVVHSDKKNAKKTEKIRFALAGVEVNLLIAGICLLAAVQCYQSASTMLSVANINIAFAAVNLLPAYGLDGEQALSAVFEVDSISKEAKKWLSDRRRRRKLLRSGLPGYICLCIFVVILMFNILFWILICLDIPFMFLYLL